MALLNIVRASILPPQTRSTNTLDMNKIDGDSMYAEIRMLIYNDSTAYHIPADGYLKYEMCVCVIKQVFKMDTTMNFYMEYDDDIDSLLVSVWHCLAIS